MQNITSLMYCRKGDYDMDMFEAPALTAQMSEVEAAPPHMPYAGK
jgi:hypothetical protein